MYMFRLRTALFWAVTPRIVAIPYHRFGTPSLSSPSSRVRNPRRTAFLDSWPLKMAPIGCPETPARNCHSSLRNSQQERRSHLLSGGSLQSYMIWLFKDSIPRDKFIVTSNDPWVKWTKNPLMGVWLFCWRTCPLCHNVGRLWGRRSQLPDGFVSHSALQGLWVQWFAVPSRIYFE